MRLHYEVKGRIEALLNLSSALEEAEARIAAAPQAGLPVPRPYPALARPGEACIMAGRYWVAYRVSIPPVILAVFDSTADIPGRF